MENDEDLDYIFNDDLVCEYYISHYGVAGQKWGVRRYQNKDGSLTTEGREHYKVGAPKKKTPVKNALKRVAKAAKNVSKNSKEKKAEKKAAKKAKKDKTTKTSVTPVDLNVDNLNTRTAFKGRKIQDMSDEELKAYKNRLLNEKAVIEAEALYKKYEKAQYDKEHKVQATLKNVGKVVGSAAGDAAKNYLSKEVKDLTSYALGVAIPDGYIESIKSSIGSSIHGLETSSMKNERLAKEEEQAKAEKAKKAEEKEAEKTAKEYDKTYGKQFDEAYKRASKQNAKEDARSLEDRQKEFYKNTHVKDSTFVDELLKRQSYLDKAEEYISNKGNMDPRVASAIRDAAVEEYEKDLKSRTKLGHRSDQSFESLSKNIDMSQIMADANRIFGDSYDPYEYGPVSRDFLAELRSKALEEAYKRAT